MTTYVLLSFDARVRSVGLGRPSLNPDGDLRALVKINEVEAESVALDGVTVSAEAMSFNDPRFAVMAGQTIMSYNREFDPPLNLVLGEAVDGQLAALLLPPEPQKSDRLVRTAAHRYGILVRRLPANGAEFRGVAR